MNESVSDLYTAPDIDEYQDLNLLDLSEHCAALEAQLYTIANSLPPSKRQIIENYISTRNDLETETVKTALRWGKRHYK